jgi:hypothetical protein
MRRIVSLAAAMAMALGLVGAPPALASAPNDTVAGATVVAVPSTTTQDTSSADTTDPAETALNEFCGAPVVEHGVWFTFTPASDGFLAFDTSASDYSAGMMLFAGTPTADGLLTCGPQTILSGVTGGQAYNVLVFGDGLTAATGGNLIFVIREATPPPSISLTVNRSGSVDRFGNVHIWGTVTCTSTDGTGTLFEIFGDVTQRVGRILIRGFFDTLPFTPCDGAPHRWDAYFSGDNGIFAGGKAATVALAFGCTDLCSDSFVTATVQLNRAGK